MYVCVFVYVCFYYGVQGWREYKEVMGGRNKRGNDGRNRDRSIGIWAGAYRGHRGIDKH